MLQVARLAPKSLGDEASLLVADFLRSQLNADGGFKDRGGASDLYYTVFGLEGLLALRADLPTSVVTEYLRSFGDGEGLDFVHLCCLARCWADVRGTAPREAILRRLEAFQSRDGAYSQSKNAEHGTVYACFLALGAHQDLGANVPDPGAMLRCMNRLRADDGGFANDHLMPMGLTPPTAAAVTLLRHLDQPAEPGLAKWLLERCRPDGGFFATPQAPLPDLLSTATALHALSGMQADIDPIKEPCLDFIDSLWTNRGAFYGTWEDDAVDCEYTYYGLLALGHLSV